MMTRGQYEDILARQCHIYDTICNYRADHFEMLSLQCTLYSSAYPNQAKGWFVAAAAGREKYHHSLMPFGRDEGGGSGVGGFGSVEEEVGLSEGSADEEE